MQNIVKDGWDPAIFCKTSNGFRDDIDKVKLTRPAIPILPYYHLCTYYNLSVNQKISFTGFGKCTQLAINALESRRRIGHAFDKIEQLLKVVS